MTLPPKLHTSLLSLTAFKQPALWGLVGSIAVLAVAGRQYLSHPVGVGPLATHPQGATRGPGSLSLTRAEQAAEAEADPLSLVLNPLQPATSDLVGEVASLETLSAKNLAELSLPSPAAAESLLEVGTDAVTSPFATYLERIQFPVRDAPVNLYQQAPSSRHGFGSGLVAGGWASPSWHEPTQPQPSPLERALQQSMANQAVGSGEEAAAGSTTAVSEGATAADAATQPYPWRVEGHSTGISQRFMRTTPQMSPPPGTTGYTLPPGLGASPASSLVPQVPPQGLPAAGLDPDLRSIVPAPGTLVPSIPQPTSPGTEYVPPQSLGAPAPFTAPRPPGSYTGGGYVHTFSDPSGPMR